MSTLILSAESWVRFVSVGVVSYNEDIGTLALGASSNDWSYHLFWNWWQFLLFKVIWIRLLSNEFLCSLLVFLCGDPGSFVNIGGIVSFLSNGVNEVSHFIIWYSFLLPNKKWSFDWLKVRTYHCYFSFCTFDFFFLKF